MATDWSTWAQLYIGGVWTVLPELVAANPGVKLERGVASDLDVKPGICTWRLLDPYDRFRPSNAASDLYGQTGQYMRGAFATGGSVRFTGETDAMNPGQTEDHQSELERPHTWTFARYRAGQWVGINGTVAAVADPGAGGFAQVLRFTASGSAGQAYPQPAFAYARAVEPGATYTARMWVYSPVATTITVALDVSDSAGGYVGGAYPSVALAAATWTEVSVTETVDPTGAFAVVHPTLPGPVAAGALVYVGSVAMWDVRGPSVRGNRWVDVTVAGPLTRVGRWRDPLASPLFTQIQGAYATTLRGYWPLEDLSGATSLFNVSHSGKPGAMNLVRPASGDGPEGSGQVVELSAGGSMSFPVASMSTTAGYQLAFAARTPGVDGTNRDVFVWKDTAARTYRWRASTTGYGLHVATSDGTVLLDESYAAGEPDATAGQWVYTRVKVRQNGGNVQIEPSWYAERAENFWGVTTSYAGSVGAPTALAVPSGTQTEGGNFAHVFVVTGVADDLESGDFTDAFRGYRGDLTTERFTRLCASRGLSYQVRGTTRTTMGPQPLVTFLDLLKEIRATERGLIFDRASNTGVILATRDYLYEQAATPVLELTYPRDVSGTLQEVASGADLFNLVTAKNRGGSQAVAELTSGRYGTQNPPTGSGRLDKTVDVNLASDGDLADAAGWWLAFYTQAGPRFDTIVVDLDAHPELATACNTAEPGQFIRLSGRTPDPLLLMIISTAQSTHRARNVFTFGVVAGAVFNVGVYDDAASRYDSATTTLAEDLDATETAVDIRTTNYHDRWSTTAVPYDWTVAGERMTVTAMTTATYASGYWTQTATVERSANGVIKAQTTGAQVGLADPVYYG